jgi:hypothetical protein
MTAVELDQRSLVARGKRRRELFLFSLGERLEGLRVPDVLAVQMLGAVAAGAVGICNARLGGLADKT